MSDLEQQFQQAAKDVANLKTRPDDQELLNVYGLYKQATVGDNKEPKPGFLDLKGKAKHQAWKDKEGLSQDKAKQEYIDLVKKLIAKYELK